MTTSSCFLKSACVATLAGLSCIVGMPAWAQAAVELPSVRVNYLTSTKLGTTAPGASVLERVPQPPLLASDGNLYVMGEWGGIYSTTTSPGFYSLYANFEASLRAFNYPGALVQSALSQRMYSASIGWETTLGSTYQQKEAVFRAEFDGTRAELLTSTDGAVYHPNGVLLVDAADGQDRLYGLDMGPGGNGRLFRIDQADASDSSGSFTTVHEFGAGNGPDGRQQPNGMIQSSDGWFYGLTAYPRGVPYADGTPTDPATPTGSLYRIHPDQPDSYEVLHEFTLAEGEIAWNSMYFVSSTTLDQNAGENQLSWLVEGLDGYLYGGLSIGNCSTLGYVHTSATEFTLTSRTSPLCGASYVPTGRSGSGFANGKSMHASSYPHYDGPRVHGALYRIAKDGSGFTILHSFSGENGSQPRGSLVLAPDGAIYGTTLSGGANQDNAQQYYVGQSSTVLGYEPTYDGTLFRIVPANIRLASDGTVLASGFEHLHSFAAGVDGKRPNGLSLGNDGRLYGTTLYGGRGYTQESSGRVYLNGQNGTLFQVDLDGASLPASVTITAQPSPVTTGRTAQITWTTYGAANCKATGGASGDGWAGDQPTEGTLTVSPAAGTYYYTLTCTNTLTGGTVGNYTTLFVDVNASETDGNQVEYGNGGGALTSGALALLAGLGAPARSAPRCKRTAPACAAWACSAPSSTCSCSRPASTCCRSTTAFWPRATARRC
ncbi:MAG: hypothetical protein GAK30_02220 [Paracidovorax wautersii]|uniref:Uncharacterized protein n=1 Tax=Paracidovorax wautersii TaxID=1177982 RepID=A0A7V8FNH3_9BURK|nr:MAG: hypothetical protein GAK30_02220 [Paracidovorax wautersii]